MKISDSSVRRYLSCHKRKPLHKYNIISQLCLIKHYCKQIKFIKENNLNKHTFNTTRVNINVRMWFHAAKQFNGVHEILNPHFARVGIITWLKPSHTETSPVPTYARWNVYSLGW